MFALAKQRLQLAAISLMDKFISSASISIYTMLVCCSPSGESIDTLNAAVIAQRAHSVHLIVCIHQLPAGLGRQAYASRCMY